jgi:quercetin dioxygenase-like cupin family protein
MGNGSPAYALGPNQGEALWFFGNLVTVKAATNDTGGSYTLSEWLNPPGFASPVHVHHSEDEAIYVLDGQVEFHCGEQVFAAGPGAFVLLPKGVPHWLQVTSDVPVRSLVLTTPAQFERFVAEAGEPARARQLPPPGPPDLGVARLGLSHALPDQIGPGRASGAAQPMAPPKGAKR